MTPIIPALYLLPPAPNTPVQDSVLRRALQSVPLLPQPFVGSEDLCAVLPFCHFESHDGE